MNRYTFMAFLRVFTFGLITLGLFFGGALGAIVSIKQYNNARELEKSDNIQHAIITLINRGGPRSGGDNIHFQTKSDGQTYKYNLFKIGSGKIEIGQEIEVKFDEERTSFFITNFSSAIYNGFIVEIVLFAICFVFSIFFLLGTIEMYKKEYG